MTKDYIYFYLKPINTIQNFKIYEKTEKKRMARVCKHRYPYN